MFKAPSSKDTQSFYDRLISGSVKRSLWGTSSRFDPSKIAHATSTKIHYENVIKPYCSTKAEALDIGCSTGGFTGVLAKHCQSVVGVDLSKNAIDLANSHFSQNELSNCIAKLGNGCHLDFDHETFDLIQMIDVIHHVENAEKLCQEVHRILRPGGKLIVFEPNKYNLALWLMCAIDRNEWGALKLGSKQRYKTLFAEHFHIETIEYNGLLIGPNGQTSTRIADWLCQQQGFPGLQTQCPKIFILLSKKYDDTLK